MYLQTAMGRCAFCRLKKLFAQKNLLNTCHHPYLGKEDRITIKRSVVVGDMEEGEEVTTVERKVEGGVREVTVERRVVVRSVRE